MIKNKILVVSFVLSLIIAIPVFAQDAGGGATPTTTATAQPATTEAITTQDLSAKNVGLLPTSPLYFLKNWNRTIQKTFTFNPVKKAELEVKFANERAAEIKKLEETAPQNVAAITNASVKYQQNMDQLKTRLEGLKETSQNPNVDNLLNKLADQSLKHQQLFDELKTKFADQKDLTQNLDQAQQKSIDTQAIVVEKIDSMDKFKARVENAATAQKSEFKDLKAAEFIDRLGEKVAQKPEFIDKGKEISNLKQDLLLKFGAQLESQQLSAQTSTSTSVAPTIKELPGDQLRRLKLLDEVREQVVNPELKSELNVTRQGILDKTNSKGLINEGDVKTEIGNADQLIQKIENLISQREGDVGVSVKQLLERAKFNLESAKSAFDVGNYGNAFGQATAASAAAKNALNQLMTTSKDYQNIVDDLKNRYDTLNAKVKTSNINEADNPKLYSLLSDTEKQILELSKLINQKAAPDKINALIQGIKLSLSTIENFLMRRGFELQPRAVEAIPVSTEGTETRITKPEIEPTKPSVESSQPQGAIAPKPIEPQLQKPSEVKPFLPLKPTISPDKSYLQPTIPISPTTNDSNTGAVKPTLLYPQPTTNQMYPQPQTQPQNQTYPQPSMPRY